MSDFAMATKEEREKAAAMASEIADRVTRRVEEKMRREQQRLDRILLVTATRKSRRK